MYRIIREAWGDLSTHYSGVFIETVTAFLSSLSFPSSLPSRAEEGVPRPCFAYPGTRRLTCTSGSLLAQERRAGVPHGALALPASSGRGGCEEIHGGGVPVGVHAQTRVCSCRSQTQWGDACPRLGLFCSHVFPADDPAAACMAPTARSRCPGGWGEGGHQVSRLWGSEPIAINGRDGGRRRGARGGCRGLV